MEYPGYRDYLSLNEMIWRPYFNSICNYYTKIHNEMEKKKMDEIKFDFSFESKAVSFTALSNKDLVIKKLLYLLDWMKELHKKDDNNPYIEWAEYDNKYSKTERVVVYHSKYTAKGGIVYMEYVTGGHKPKDRHLCVYIQTRNFESVIKFNSDDKSVPDSVWTCLDNFFLLSTREEEIFSSAVDDVLMHADFSSNSIIKDV